MKILILSDIHGAVENLEIVTAREKDAEAVLVCGDLTHFGGRRQAVPVLEVLRDTDREFVAVHGNCDKAAVAEYLSAEGVSVHLKAQTIRGIHIFGWGGSLPAPIPTPSTYSENEARSALGAFQDYHPDSPWIFITHQPPLESSADMIRSGRHVGSSAVADFIRTMRPPLVCTGHIHEAYSVTDFGGSLLVNPGSLKEGRYAVAEVGAGDVRAELRTL